MISLGFSKRDSIFAESNVFILRRLGFVLKGFCFSRHLDLADFWFWPLFTLCWSFFGAFFSLSCGCFSANTCFAHLLSSSILAIILVFFLVILHELGWMKSFRVMDDDGLSDGRRDSSKEGQWRTSHRLSLPNPELTRLRGGVLAAPPLETNCLWRINFVWSGVLIHFPPATVGWGRQLSLAYLFGCATFLARGSVQPESYATAAGSHELHHPILCIRGWDCRRGVSGTDTLPAPLGLWLVPTSQLSL